MEQIADERLIFNANSGLAEGLFNSGYIALIICAPTGIWWSHQCGHYGCVRACIEGFIIPYNDCCLNGPEAHEVYNECGFMDELDDKEKDIVIEKINESIKNYQDNIITMIRFNDKKRDQLREGLIPVLVYFKHFLNKPVMSGEELGLIIGTKTYEGYLCAHNCD